MSFCDGSIVFFTSPKFNLMDEEISLCEIFFIIVVTSSIAMGIMVGPQISFTVIGSGLLATSQSEGSPIKPMRESESEL